MQARFKFAVDTEQFEVIGEYGNGHQFLITRKLADRPRTLGVQGAPGGVRVDAVLTNVTDSDELLITLRQKFCGLTEFEQV
jgi:hypothetical protein